MQYKEIELSDVQNLAALYADTFNSAPWNDEWTIETASKRLFQMINMKEAYGIMALEDDELCGMILGTEEEYFNGRIFTIKEFCVSNQRRKSGIGTTLLKEFEMRLKEKGMKEILLLTAKGDNTEGFYSKRDYNSYTGMVVMGKQL